MNFSRKRIRKRERERDREREREVQEPDREEIEGERKQSVLEKKLGKSGRLVPFSDRHFLELTTTFSCQIKESGKLLVLRILRPACSIRNNCPSAQAATICNKSAPIYNNNDIHSANNFPNNFQRWLIGICIFKIYLVEIWARSYTSLKHFPEKHLHIFFFKRNRDILEHWKSTAHQVRTPKPKLGKLYLWIWIWAERWIIKLLERRKRQKILQEDSPFVFCFRHVLCFKRWALVLGTTFCEYEL